MVLVIVDFNCVVMALFVVFNTDAFSFQHRPTPPKLMKGNIGQMRMARSIRLPLDVAE